MALALNVVEPPAQIGLTEKPGDAVGGVLFKVVVIDAVDVHPLAAVTVTVNVPAVVNELAAVDGVAPPLHAYVPPPVAVTLILGVVQVMAVVPELLVIPAVGLGFTVSVLLAVDVQPAALVTVTV